VVGEKVPGTVLIMEVRLKIFPQYLVVCMFFWFFKRLCIFLRGPEADLLANTSYSDLTPGGVTTSKVIQSNKQIQNYSRDSTSRSNGRKLNIISKQTSNTITRTAKQHPKGNNPSCHNILKLAQTTSGTK